jgi:cytochrome oxidase Cu insertion factor (SCO1/SenC/PrrC family)
VIFVSIDPDRDSPERIKKYLNLFNKEFIGISGKSNESEDLKQVLKTFKIYCSKMNFEGGAEENYTMDHTIISYLINPKNEYLTHIGSSMGVYDLSNFIIEKINDDIKSF